MGSAAGMDKDVMKRLLRADNIPIEIFSSTYADKDKIEYDTVVERLGSRFCQTGKYGFFRRDQGI